MLLDPDQPDARTPRPAQSLYPTARAAIPPGPIEAGSYLVRFAQSADDLDRILALRYAIFNLELGEGLDGSHANGRDDDGLDGRFHHLMIQCRADDAIVGTYRMQTAEMAGRGGGWYSDQEFEVGALPESVLAESVEIGRACVAREHRNGRVLNLLWRGLARYLLWNQKRVLFGCCSLTTQDESLGWSVHRHLEAAGAVHPTLRVDPVPECRLDPGAGPEGPAQVPALFRAYLELGAKVLGPPAIDRAFKTIDWLVILDARELDPGIHCALFR